MSPTRKVENGGRIRESKYEKKGERQREDGHHRRPMTALWPSKDRNSKKVENQLANGGKIEEPLKIKNGVLMTISKAQPANGESTSLARKEL